MRWTAIVAAGLLAAGCGEEEPPAAPPATGGGDRLEVEVRPEGPAGPVERRVVTDVPAGITPNDFSPVPADVACTELYGGPATAEVTGTLAGRAIDATFSRSDGCEIARWEGVEALLGRAPGAGP